MPLPKPVSHSVQLNSRFCLHYEVGSDFNHVVCAPYPHQTRSKLLLTNLIIWDCFAWITIILRLYIRLAVTKSMWWADWMAVLATVRSYLHCFMIFSLPPQVFNACSSVLEYLRAYAVLQSPNNLC